MLDKVCFPRNCKKTPIHRVKQSSFIHQNQIDHAFSRVFHPIIQMEGEGKLVSMISNVAISLREIRVGFIRYLADRLGRPVNFPGFWNIPFINLIKNKIKNIYNSEGSGRYADHFAGIWLCSDQNIPEMAESGKTSLREQRTGSIKNLLQEALAMHSPTKTIFDNVGESRFFPINRAEDHCAVIGIFHPEKEAFDSEIDQLLDEIPLNFPLAMGILERKQDQQHPIREKHGGDHQFQTYFDSALMGMVILSPDRRFIEINDSFSQMTGYKKKELFALQWDDLTHPEDVEKSQSEYFSLLKGEIDFSVNDKRIVRKDGEIIFVHIATRAVRKPSGDADCLVVNIEDVTERKKSQESIWHQANFDMLTGLPNRFMFFDRLKEEIKKSHRGGSFLALFFIDLDRFKEINDTLGHRLGDQLLIEAASRIAHCIRTSDTASRFGGDEFAVILSQITDAQHIEEVAQKVLDSLSSPFTLEGVKEAVFISGSIGITIYPTDGLEAKTLLQNADQSMYMAKECGGNRFAYFTSALQEKAQARLLLLKELRGALALSEFSLYFQPIFNLKTGKIAKAEALLRWRHPQRGLLCPQSFITVAEETGLIREIGCFVFQEAGKWAKRWSAIRPDGFQVSINLSPAQFESNGQILENWLSHLEAQGISERSLSIEITEKLLGNVNSHVSQKLLGFSQKGISVWVDNFGSGCSSLSYLLKFQIDCLKIDQSFIRNIERDKECFMIAEASIMMAHKLGLHVVAEGVETLGQLTILMAMHCDFAQGFLFSKPLPPPEFENFLHQFSG